MILLWLLWEYRKDCKKIGKEKLAVPLRDRLFTYFYAIILPALVGLVIGYARYG